MSLNVRLVVPEGELWTGPAAKVLAKTLEGDIGLLTNHSPMLGILAPGSVVQILPQEQWDQSVVGDWVAAAVGGGFLAVADNVVSILARQAVLAADVDVAEVRAELASADPADLAGAAAGYLIAQLRAVGENI